MSFSFLENLWDTEGNVAYTSEQSNPSGRRYVGGGAMQQAPPIKPQFTPSPAMTSVAPPEQSYGMSAAEEQYPPERQNRASAARGASPSFDANAEMKALMRATLGQLYENNNQQYHKIQQLKEGRGKLTKNIQNLTYVVYALLVLCFVMAILLIIVCYQVNNLPQALSHLRARHHHLVSK